MYEQELCKLIVCYSIGCKQTLSAARCTAFKTEKLQHPCVLRVHCYVGPVSALATCPILYFSCKYFLLHTLLPNFVVTTGVRHGCAFLKPVC